MKNYDHAKIEKKWQEEWEKNKLYEVKDEESGKKNYFTLVEFTYPSGNLHVGHWYAFAVPDIFARYKRMQGFNSLYPMGFDAFGLPAENAAIKLGQDPKNWTYGHMDNMRTQLRSMGASFDWSREIVSCDPEYYKWTQWMFLQFLKNDLAYRDITKVNWCPKDMTILANEQVVDGLCERCGAEVEQRNQEQWMLRITKYADKLIDDLDTLAWPNAIKEAQKNWIGRSEGSEITFKINFENNAEPGYIPVFTTRADTLFGVTYIVLSPEHPWVTLAVDENHTGVIKNADEVKEYIAEAKKKSELDRQQAKEKTGVKLEGVMAVNPATGEEVPIWVADYVLAGYGTGAVMAVPAHDERDFQFAKKYGLPVKNVIMPHRIDEKNPHVAGKEIVFRKGIIGMVWDPKAKKYLCLKWKTQPWTTFVVGGIEDGEDPVEAARREIEEETGYSNIKFIKTVLGPVQTEFFAAHKDVNRVAHSWTILFELEEGEPKEISDEEKAKHEIFWMSESEIASGKMTHCEMDLILAGLKNPESIYTEEGILYNSGEFDNLNSEEARRKITESVGGKLVKTYRLRDWGISRQRYWGVPIPIVYDPEGKAHAVPDEHLPWLLPTDVDHTPDGTSPLARSKELKERTEKIFGAGWKPEVETMDTFVDSSWYFYRYLDNKNDNEFASEKRRDAWMPIDLYMGGAEHTTMHLLYSRFWVKALQDLGLVKESEAYTMRRNRGLILGPDGNKMSKSKGNVINPDEIVERLGADTVRLYLAFMGPYGVTVNYPWDPNGVVGVRRFLERIFKLSAKVGGETDADTILHKAIKKITEDMEEYKFNTCISQMMILLNDWEKKEAISLGSFKILLQLLSPFAPHVAEELWYKLGEKESIHLSLWPKYDTEKIIDEKMTIAIQVNGKVRSEISVDKDMPEEDIKSMAEKDKAIIPWVEGKNIVRIIYVPKRLINIVI